jgi:hypothetical protein
VAIERAHACALAGLGWRDREISGIEIRKETRGQDSGVREIT